MTTSPLAIKNTWFKTLRQHGYRLTAPRRAVVEVVVETRQYLNPSEIYNLAQARYARLGLVTVYRTLEKLEELGLVQRVHRPDHCQAFVAEISGHKHLLLCEHCGGVEYFEGDDLEDLINTVEDDSGYKINSHWLQFFGTCQECRAGK